MGSDIYVSSNKVLIRFYQKLLNSFQGDENSLRNNYLSKEITKIENANFEDNKEFEALSKERVRFFDSLIGSAEGMLRICLITPQEFLDLEQLIVVLKSRES